MNTKLAVLKSEILRDSDKLDDIFEKFDTAYQQYLGKNEYAYLVESAFHVNRIYTGFERMARNVAEAFENTIDEKSWHKSLLDRMALEVADLRPAFISEAGYEHLNELRAFRHFFRNTYDFDLDGAKFAIVAAGAKKLKEAIKKDIKAFLAFIDELLKD